MEPRIRRKELPWKQTFWASYILVLHTIGAVAISVFTLTAIDGIIVQSNNQEPFYRRTHLQVDDITTALSTAIVSLRILTGTWAVTSAWRCAFILLEINGITLQQFNRVVSWPAYLLTGSTEAYMATLILLLLAPANLVAPIITGAIGWRNADMETTWEHTGPPITSAKWYQYSIRNDSIWDGPQVLGLVRSAVGRAGFGWLEFGKNNSRSSRLMTTREQRMAPYKVTIGNLTLPFLEIHSISWGKSGFTKDIMDELDFLQQSRSNLTLSGGSPFLQEGSAVLFDEHLLKNYSTAKVDNKTRKATIPLSTVFHGTKKIALCLVFQERNDCTPVHETIFGNKSSMANLKGVHLEPTYMPGMRRCILLGTVNFTAGVVRQKAIFIRPNVIEAEVHPATSIVDDNWVTESLYLLPDVMTWVSRANWSEIPTWDNLNGYVDELIRISYQATWGEVSSHFSASPLNLTAYEFSQRFQAVVSKPRVIGWYCAQFLVLVSAALLWVLQRRSGRPIIIDTSIVALLVDSAPVLNKYDAAHELSRMSYMLGDDGGTVRLAECDVPDSGGEGRRLGPYDTQISETTALVAHDDPSADLEKPRRRFMLVPCAEAGNVGAED